MKRQILKNLFTNYLTNLLRMVLGFAIVPFLVHKLGKESYGLIVLAESSIVFFDVVKGSIWSALSRYATFALARERTREFEELLSTGRVLLLGAAALALVAGSAVAWFFPSIFRVPPELEEQSRILFFLVSLSFAISMPNMVHWAVLYAKNRYDLLNLSLSLGVVLRALSVFVLFSAFPRTATLACYGVVYLCMVLAQNEAVRLIRRRLLPGARARLSRFRMARVREMVGYGSSVAVSRVSEILYQQSPNIIINLFWGSAANAVYAIGVKFPQIFTRLFEEAAWSLTSSFNHLAALERRDRVEELYFLYTKCLTLITAPLCFTLVFIARPLVRFWVGDEFSQAADLIPVFAAPLFLQLPLCIGVCVTNAYAKVRIPSLVGLGTSAATLALGILFGKVLGMGLLGVALAVALSAFFYYAVFQPHYVGRILGVSSFRYLRQAFFVPFLWAAAVCAGCKESVLTVASAGSLLAVPPVVALFAAVYAAGGFALVFNERERKRLKETVHLLSQKRAQAPAPQETPAVAASGQA